MQEAVEAVIGTLGMQPCEGTEAVPPNARSHTALLAGIFVGYQQVGFPCIISSSVKVGRHASAWWPGCMWLLLIIPSFST